MARMEDAFNSSSSLYNAINQSLNPNSELSSGSRTFVDGMRMDAEAKYAAIRTAEATEDMNQKFDEFNASLGKEREEREKADKDNKRFALVCAIVSGVVSAVLGFLLAMYI